MRDLAHRAERIAKKEISYFPIALRSALCALLLLYSLDFNRPKKAVGLDHQD
jgi:hypothetical protein